MSDIIDIVIVQMGNNDYLIQIYLINGIKNFLYKDGECVVSYFVGRGQEDNQRLNQYN